MVNGFVVGVLVYGFSKSNYYHYQKLLEIIVIFRW